jgi:lysophospholipase
MAYGGSGARGIALIVPGWAEPCEKYAEVALDLIDRGFETYGFDPRGQGLSQRIAEKDLRGRVDDFEKHVDDFRAVVDSLPEGRPLTILAHSMGGLMTLAWLRRGGKADAVALSAPATRIFPSRWQRGGVRALAKGLALCGFGDMPLSKKGGMAMEFEGNTLTSDPRRHAMLRDLLLADERLELPRTTPYFVRSLHREQSAIRKEGALSGVSGPILLVSLPKDSWVDSRHHHELANAHPALFAMVEVEDSLHEILMEKDQYRDQFWDAFDGYVAEALPGQAPAPEPEPEEAAST